MNNSVEKNTQIIRIYYKKYHFKGITIPQQKQLLFLLKPEKYTIKKPPCF